MSGPHSGDPDAGDSDSEGPDWDGPDDSRRNAERTTDTGDGDVTIEDDGIVRWFLGTDDGTVVAVRDVLSSVAIVAVIALVLFAISGIWPPLVAVESGSMEPNMERGDLIFVVDDDRFAGDQATDGTGVVTLEDGQNADHEKFGQPGDVIVFKPDGSEYRTPIIHRAHFWVDEGENWVDTRANDEYVADATCAEVPTCPAPHDGFVTKGDDNSGYDQYHGGAGTTVVHPDWVTGKAMIRVPWLGHVRLFFDSLFGGMIAPVSFSQPASYGFLSL
ncbi:S26 family signal peptidase [Natrarchaeobius chitinivorans]|uniref:S26 family signal peptidase n=1 Tax=Natrarchaeobius chitinivorans TaxID=1679083 RepID=A0A3N6LVU6_NATCH|nr:S26 family signal peptidase [Natrarchaeobius chitinivorans]RQG94623.1 S26 family signal peptidase [Natrarchaeobius chitinivorans]